MNEEQQYSQLMEALRTLMNTACEEPTWQARTAFDLLHAANLLLLAASALMNQPRDQYAAGYAREKISHGIKNVEYAVTEFNCHQPDFKPALDAPAAKI